MGGSDFGEVLSKLYQEECGRRIEVEKDVFCLYFRLVERYFDLPMWIVERGEDMQGSFRISRADDRLRLVQHRCEIISEKVLQSQTTTVVLFLSDHQNQSSQSP